MVLFVGILDLEIYFNLNLYMPKRMNCNENFKLNIYFNFSENSTLTEKGTLIDLKFFKIPITPFFEFFGFFSYY